MSRFYADIQGQRGAASRMGSPESGIQGHIRGWHIGISVTCHAIEQSKGEEIDECIAWETGGSNSYGDRRELARLRYPPLANPKWKFEEKKKK